MTFQSGGFLVQLDQKRLPKHVTCPSSDLARQQFTLHFGATAPLLVPFEVCALKAENATSLLSIAIENGPASCAFGLRINTYNLDRIFDPKVLFWSLDILRELPGRWRYIVLTVAILLLLIAAPWYGTSLQLLAVRFGVRQDITQSEFDDDFERGPDQWYRLNSSCAGVPPPGKDNLGRVEPTFLTLSSPCFAIAKLKSSLDGRNPFARAPSLADFTATFTIQLGSSGRVTVLLHAKRPWLPLFGKEARGDHLSIERLPAGSDKKLCLKFNTSSACPKKDTAILTSNEIKEPINKITVTVTSLAGLYRVTIDPAVAPSAFDDEPHPEFSACSLFGSIGFLATNGDDYRISGAIIKPGATAP